MKIDYTITLKDKKLNKNKLVQAWLKEVKKEIDKELEKMTYEEFMEKI